MNKPLLVFDMDGVLVDVTESYRATIVETVKHFTGVEIDRGRIQDLKNQGGWNDDWQLSHHIISSEGVDVPLDRVIEYFQTIFHGDGSDGLIMREVWMDRTGILPRLAANYRFAVFTGRMKWEAEVTLKRFAADLTFDPIVGMHEVKNLKPSPDGLLQILESNCDCPVVYLGDTVDDARCAKAAEVPFIGIAAPSNPRYLDLVFLFQAEGAAAVIDDINYLDTVLK